MSDLTNLIERYIEKHCQDKRYTIKKTKNPKYIRINISNISETIPLNLYVTGTLTVGGSPKCKLHQEFQELNDIIKKSPDILKSIEQQKIRACATKYNILLEEVRGNIKNTLSKLDASVKYYEAPTPSEEYRARLTKDQQSLSVTQYKNGTLFLQGKEDKLFSNCCDMVEEIATPTGEEVILRFFAADEESLQKFTSSYTPRLLEEAEKQIRKILRDDIFDFLENHDQKWFIAAECLRIVNIPLPEYSPIVMPASKAFEGYIKKLLVKVGFYSSNHFDSKKSSFTYLNDPEHPKRIEFIAKEKHAETYLRKISVCLDTNRNFMMHSDGATITKIDKYEDAVKKLEEIYCDVKEIYEYFKKATVFGL